MRKRTDPQLARMLKRERASTRARASQPTRAIVYIGPSPETIVATVVAIKSVVALDTTDDIRLAAVRALSEAATPAPVSISNCTFTSGGVLDNSPHVTIAGNGAASARMRRAARAARAFRA